VNDLRFTLPIHVPSPAVLARGATARGSNPGSILPVAMRSRQPPARPTSTRTSLPTTMGFRP
jgi:hypothetical protein